MMVIIRYVENLKSCGKPELNTCNNNDNSSSDHHSDYPDSVVLESSAKPSQTGSTGLVLQKIQEPLTQGNHAPLGDRVKH